MPKNDSAAGLSRRHFLGRASALAFAAEGKVNATIEQLPLDSINEVFSRLREGKVNGRVVLDVAQPQH